MEHDMEQEEQAIAIMEQIGWLLGEMKEGTFRKREEGQLLFDVDVEGELYEVRVVEDEYEADREYKEGEVYALMVEAPEDLSEVPKSWLGSLRKGEKLKLWEKLSGAVESGEEFEGEIIGINPGGLSVDVGVRAFVPRSHGLATGENDQDVKDLIGTKDRFKILEFDPKHANVVASRRSLIVKRQRKERQEVLEKLEVGSVVSGTVTGVEDFGVFVEVGAGIQGMVHASELSWSRYVDPRESYVIGDPIEVKVLRIVRKGKKGNRISFGVKQLSRGPWEGVTERYKVGDRVKGRVVSLQDFGAFVEVEAGLTGLVHVTELSWDPKVRKVEGAVEVGEEVEVRIVSIEEKKKRLSLSIRQCGENPLSKFIEEHHTESVVKGTITKIESYGVVVDLGEGVEGLIRGGDLSWTKRVRLGKEEGELRGGEVEFWHSVGDEIEVRILSIDKKERRVQLGLKQLKEDPWKTLVEEVKVGTKVKVTIKALADFGAFAALDDEIEGLIHISELREERVNHPRDVVRPGQEVEVLVLGIDAKERRLSFSLYRNELEDETPGEYYEAQETTTSLGDILRAKLGLKDQENPLPLSTMGEGEET